MEKNIYIVSPYQLGEAEYDDYGDIIGYIDIYTTNNVGNDLEKAKIAFLNEEFNCYSWRDLLVTNENLDAGITVGNNESPYIYGERISVKYVELQVLEMLEAMVKSGYDVPTELLNKIRESNPDLKEIVAVFSDEEDYFFNKRLEKVFLKGIGNRKEKN